MKKIFVLFSVLLLSAQLVYADVIPPEISMETINTKGKTVPTELINDYIYSIRKQTDGYVEKYCEKDSKKCGLKDKDGNIITPPVYDYILLRKNGFFTVEINGKWGLTDKKGSILIKPFSEMPLYFKDDYSFAQIDNKIGIINKKGEWVITPEWEQTDPRCDSRYAVMQENVIVYKNNKYSFINLETLKTSKNKYDYLKPFSEGLAYACINEKCGYLNKNEEWKIPPKFKKTLGLYDDDNMSFHEGLAAVQLGKNKQGYIDKKGKIVLKNFYFAGRFSQGLAAAKKTKDGMLGYIDKTGKWAIPPKYESAGFFYGYGLEEYGIGLANVQRYMSKSEFIKKYGEWRSYQPKFNAKKRYMKLFSAVLLILVIIAGISIRWTGKKD